MPLSLGSLAPNFRAVSTLGDIEFHDWIGGSWCILFAHPKAFTSVCTSELGSLARLAPEFAKRNTKILSVAVDTLPAFEKWVDDIEAVAGVRPDFPMIADIDMRVAKSYDMLPANAEGPVDSRTVGENLTVRSLFIIAPDKTIRLTQAYPLLVGRNMEEILRAVDALQRAERHPVATPADWRPGEPLLAGPDLSEAEIERRFGDDARMLNNYMTLVPDPDTKESVPTDA